jgi:hypothetical protein
VEGRKGGKWWFRASNTSSQEIDEFEELDAEEEDRERSVSGARYDALSVVSVASFTPIVSDGLDRREELLSAPGCDGDGGGSSTVELKDRLARLSILTLVGCVLPSFEVWGLF